MGVKAFEQFFHAIGENLYIRHFGVRAGFEGGVRARVMLGCWDGRCGGCQNLVDLAGSSVQVAWGLSGFWC